MLQESRDSLKRSQALFLIINQKLPANGALQGKVIDDTGRPVAGAVITLLHFFQVQGRDQQAISTWADET